MGIIADLFRSVYRDFVTEGVPSSGGYEPPKQDLRGIGEQIERSIGAASAGIIFYDTAAARDADTTRAVGTLGRVSNVPTIFRYTGGSPPWVQDDAYYQGLAAVVAPVLGSTLNPRSVTLADDTRNRVLIAKGGVYQNAGAGLSGAIKITLPAGVDARQMATRVRVLDQYTDLVFSVSGTNNVGGWNYMRARVDGESTIEPRHPVRFGNDGQRDYFTIGNVDYAFWTTLAVTILDVTFTGGPITETWLGDWEIELVLNYPGTVSAPIVPAGVVTTANVKFDNGRVAMALGPFSATGTKASNYNVCIGPYAGGFLDQGFNNTLLGMQAGASLTNGSANFAGGTQALQYATTAIQNTAINIHALLSLIDGIGNIAIGAGTMEYLLHGNYNVALGNYAGRDVQGDRNVFLGNRAGMTLVNVSDKLHIANNEFESLIYGDFAARTAGVNGKFTVDQFLLKDLNPAPASATAAGTKGETRFTADYVYLCVAANSWKRTPLAAW